MNDDRMKIIEVDNRKFAIRKFNAKTSLKISKLIIAKVLPAFESIIPTLTKDSVNSIQNKLQDISEIDISEVLSFEGVSRALDLISEDDMDKIIDTSLRNCFEILPAGQTVIQNPNGTFGVPNVEDDTILVMRLTAEALIWSISGFFDVNRLGSILKPISASFMQDAQM